MLVTSTPSKLMVPSLGASSVPSTWSSVDLPTPEAPTTEAISPGRSSKSSPRSTSMTRPPWRNFLVSPRTTTWAPPRTAASADAAVAGPVAVDAVVVAIAGCAKVVGAPKGVNDAMAQVTPETRRT